MILEDIESEIYTLIESAMEEIDCHVLSINGTYDHVHILFHLNPGVSLGDVIKRAKAKSSFRFNETSTCEIHLKWQRGYYAYSVAAWQLEKMKKYIEYQKEQHLSATLADELKALSV